MRKKNGAARINLPNFRQYYKATVLNKVWHHHKTRNRDQRNKIESPEINPHIYGRVIFDKGGKTIQRRAKIASSKVGLGKLNSYMLKNEIGTFLNTIQKDKLKWIKDLN